MKNQICKDCGAKPGRGGVILRHKKGCTGDTMIIKLPTELVPKTQEIIRSDQDLPEVGKWYMVSLRSLVDFDSVTDKQMQVLDLIIAPCLSVEPHGRDYRVTFDMESTKRFVGQVPGQLFAKAGDVANMLHTLAESLEGVK